MNSYRAPRWWHPKNKGFTTQANIPPLVHVWTSKMLKSGILFSILLQHAGAQTDKKREQLYAFLSTENNSVHMIVSILIIIYNFDFMYWLSLVTAGFWPSTMLLHHIGRKWSYCTWETLARFIHIHLLPYHISAL